MIAGPPSPSASNTGWGPSLDACRGPEDKTTTTLRIALLHYCTMYHTTITTSTLQWIIHDFVKESQYFLLTFVNTWETSLYYFKVYFTASNMIAGLYFLLPCSGVATLNQNRVKSTLQKSWSKMGWPIWTPFNCGYYLSPNGLLKLSEFVRDLRSCIMFKLVIL